jgi:endo-1,4-beta-xylanase
MKEPKRGLRRALACALAPLLLVAVFAAPSAGAAQDNRQDDRCCHGMALKKAARGTGAHIGTAVPIRLLDDSRAVDILTREFNSITPENEMMWWFVHPAPGVWNFGPLDRIVAFAQQHNMVVEGHAFLWDGLGALPGWVQAITDPDELKAVIADHMRVLMTRYKGTIHRWNVVNEPLLFPTPAMNPNHFFKVIGPNYIDWAFRTAHSIDPDAQLVLNEVFQESLPTTGAATLALLGTLVAQGTPIDRVGMQMHLFSGKPLQGAVSNFVTAARALGLEVSITEMDQLTTLQGSNPATAPQPGQDPLEYQAESFHQVISEFLAAGGSDITFWGVVDKYSWLNTPTASAQALMWNDDYEPKPAAQAVRNALLERAASM